MPVCDFCLHRIRGVCEGEKGIMGVWTKCLLEIERSGDFSTPQSRKRFSRAEKREGEGERSLYRILERVVVVIGLSAE